MKSICRQCGEWSETESVRDAFICPECVKQRFDVLPMKENSLTIPDRFKCPYCEGKLEGYAESWSQDEDTGLWMIEGIALDCVTAPEFPDEDDEEAGAMEAWDNWNDQHSYMPYVNWLPLHNELIGYLNGRYRFTDLEPAF